MLHNQILSIVNPSVCDSEATRVRYLKRLEEGSFTRDENSKTHFCAYFLPYNKKNKKVFLIHHKKSGFWLSPGGHIDKGEGLLDTLNREIDEELGVKGFFKELPAPFLLTITPIENMTQPCKAHFDIWYLVDTDGDNFNVSAEEFHDAKWMSIEDAMKIVTDPANIKALKILGDK